MNKKIVIKQDLKHKIIKTYCSTVTDHLATREFRQQPTRHQAKCARHQTQKKMRVQYIEVNLAIQTNFFYFSVRKLRCEHVVGEVIICRLRFTAVTVLPVLEEICLQQAVLSSLVLGKFAVTQQSDLD